MGAEIQSDTFSDADFALFRERLHGGLTELSALLEQPSFGQKDLSLGTELEMFLVDENGFALPISSKVVRCANRASVTHEMGAFDIELSSDPVSLRGRPFSRQAENLRAEVAELSRHAAEFGARLVPVGVLPTLRRGDFTAAAITDMPRYRALASAMKRQRNAPFRICIDGEDPLRLTTDEVSMEAANAAFHVHLRVKPQEFAGIFNAALLLTAPLLAASGNSPLFLGHRLWHETRVALFKQAGDDRTSENWAHFRLPSRIGFGSGWVRSSALELFAESVALHEPLLAECRTHSEQERPGELWELRLHHGTVWKWNRPVYDPADGGHLRIEFRALPSGPTVTDMLANTAFLIGGVLALAPMVSSLLPSFPFALAERNFYRAAQFGLDATLAWPMRVGASPEPILARDLLPKLIPLAEEGLSRAGVERDEAEHFLEIFSERVSCGVTGAVWQRETFRDLLAKSSRRERASTGMLERYLANVESGEPVCRWPRECD